MGKPGKTMQHYMKFHERVKAGKVKPYTLARIDQLREGVQHQRGMADSWHLDVTLPKRSKRKILSIGESSSHEFEDLHGMINAAKDERGLIEDAMADAADEPPFGAGFNRMELMKIASLAEDLLQIPPEHHAGIIAGLIRHRYPENPVRLLLGFRMLKEHIRPAL